MDINIKIGGEAGFGIMASGLVLIRSFSRAGLKAITINDYPSLIRGGHNVILVRVADHDIFATDDHTDLLIALNRETFDLHKSELTDGAAIIFDSETVKIEAAEAGNAKLFPIPLFKLAKDNGGNILMRNTVALGAALALVDFDFTYLEKVIGDQFGRKGETVVALNVQMAKVGFDHIKQTYAQGWSKKIAPRQDQPPQMVLTGNEAVGLGALRGGLKFFACYPMTPINGLLYYLSGIAEKAGIVYKQPEDEISAINMALGASFAGVRSMVATSGGGFSLMVEGTSLAGMLELPIVIIFGQRPGPATGLPTWTTQSDLHFVLNAGQGEFPRLVLAPGDMEEAYALTATAFNLAEKYQTPVFVMVDKYICESYFSVDMQKFTQLPYEIDRGKLVSEAEQIKVADFPRYQFADDGISPRPIPGRKGGVFRVNSDEHDIHGYSCETAENTKAMIEKRIRKLTTAQKEVPEAVLYGSKEAAHTLVGWGSTKGVVLEVIRQLAAQGKGDMVNYVQISWVNPFPTDSVKYILSRAQHIVDIEGNHNAQMADLIQLKTGIKITDKILKYDGRPFYPKEIIETLLRY